jgi:hypothetical protein
MTAALHRREIDRETLAVFRSFLPSSPPDHERDGIPLPFYRDCLVCGTEREFPGLKRRFYLAPPPAVKTVITRAGSGEGDKESFDRFQVAGILHPVAPWPFWMNPGLWRFHAGCPGGVTGPHPLFVPGGGFRAGEPLNFLGRGHRKRVQPPRACSSGVRAVAAAVHPRGRLEPVSTAAGQFMVARN